MAKYLDSEYIKYMLEKSSSVNFEKHVVKDNDFGFLVFTYYNKEEAFAIWNYLLYKLSKANFALTLSITKDNFLDITITIGKVNITTTHKNFNAFELSQIINDGFVTNDSTANICCQYAENDKLNMLHININGEKETCLMKGRVHRLDNDGYEFLPPQQPDIFS